MCHSCAGSWWNISVISIRTDSTKTHTLRPVSAFCTTRGFRWYDRADLGLRKNIVDVQFLAAMNHKSGSFSVNPRLQRHFVTFGCQTPGSDDLTTVSWALTQQELNVVDESTESRVLGKSPRSTSSYSRGSATCRQTVEKGGRAYWHTRDGRRMLIHRITRYMFSSIQPEAFLNPYCSPRDVRASHSNLR